MDQHREFTGITNGGFVRPDFCRQERTGIPEVILADRKQPLEALAIVRQFLAEKKRAILSRVPLVLEEHLREEWDNSELTFLWYPAARGAVLRHADLLIPENGGKVGVLTAGTADIPIAEEAVMLLREIGCMVLTAYDVGVAGLHRLFEPLQEMVQRQEVDVLIVAAGMDGALPSVVSGLVDIPVIGLPTSVGYGLGGKGESALLSMLQSCSPGLAVVNIDNGIGAAAMAGLIALRAARARQQVTTPLATSAEGKEVG